MVNGEAGKGDTYRPVNLTLWGKNYERIYGKKHAKKKSDKRNFGKKGIR